MGTPVNVYEAKTRLSQLIDKAAAGEEVIIARNGTPVAKLIAVHRAPTRREPGALRGKIFIADDFDEDHDLTVLFGGDGTVDPE